MVRDVDIVRSGHIVVGSALIPVSGGGDHNLAVGDFPVQAAGTAEEDVFGTLQFGEGIFDEGCGDRCADVGLVEGKTLAVMADQIVRGPAGGAPEGGKLAVGIVFRDELLDFMGKSDDTGVHLWRVLFGNRIDDGGGLVVKGIGDHVDSPFTDTERAIRDPGWLQ